MPTTENIEWEIKDGKCSCKLRTDCEMAIERMLELDAPALGENFGYALMEKLKKIVGTPIDNFEYKLGRELKKYNSEQIIAKVKQRIEYDLRKKGIDVDDFVNDALCEGALNLKEAWDK